MIKLVGVGGDDARLVASVLITHFSVTVLVFAEAPFWSWRWSGLSVFVLVTEECCSLVPMALSEGLKVG